MRPDEPKTFDTHEPIDLSDDNKVREITEQLDCSPEDLAAAVEQVGSHPVAVALFLGKPEHALAS